MKLRYIITSLLAVLALAIGCTELEEAHLSEVQVSQSYIALPVNGGSVDVTVNATSDWAINDIPEWLSVSPASGAAGKYTVTFHAEAATATNEAILHLVCDGATQVLNVLQMAEAVELPISPISAVLAGEDGTTYRVKGTVGAIQNSLYGNYNVTDETGTIYVYGTLYEGAEKQFEKLGIEQGDIVTVEGPKLTYGSTIELVNVTVIAIEKSLIKVDSVEPEDAMLPIEGGEFNVNLSVKGEGVSVEIPEAAKAWLSVAGLNVSSSAASVVFVAASNEGGDRSVELTFKTSKGGVEYTAATTLTQEGAIIEATAAEINAAEDGSTQYRITGYVSSVANTKSGNLYIKDHTGEVYVYGTNDFADSGVEEGDIITVVGPKSSYKGAPQMVSVTVENRIDVKDIDLASFRALEDNKEAWYRISGTVAKSTEENTKWDETYGNFALTDGTTEVYVYGVRTGWGGDKGEFGSLGVKEGDNLTIVCYKTSYKGLIEADGCFYVSHETPAEPEEPETPETPEPTSEYSIDLSYALGSSAYDDGTATINGEENVKVLKIGTSSKAGSINFTVPAGTKSVSFYGVAWNNAATILTFSIGGSVIAEQAIEANAGASGNSPYTLTVSDSDKYTLDCSALTGENVITVSTKDGEKTRAIFFGIKAN
ncbi:MAG: BACON domain-containing protein [Candidatus Cryptobacteroides sp.]